MAQIGKNDAISLTANYAGYTQEVVNDVLNAYAHIVYKLLLKGYGCRMPILGKFELRERKAQAPREWTNPHTGQREMLGEVPPFLKPSFKFNPSITKEVRKATEGKVE